MAKQTLSLDDILEEYDTSKRKNGNTEAALDAILGTAGTSASAAEPVGTAPVISPGAEDADAKRIAKARAIQDAMRARREHETAEAQLSQPAHHLAPPLEADGKRIKLDPYGNPVKKRKKNEPLRRSTPANDYKPSDVKKPEVSFMNSVAAVEAAQRAKMNPAAEQAKHYDEAVVTHVAEDEYRPNIRKMSNSTRAKEMNGKRKTKKPEFTYSKETPAAVHARKRVDMVEKPEEPRKKVRFIVEDLQDMKPEDHIPAPLLEQPYEKSGPIRYVEKAEKTSIDLSARQEAAADDLDVRLKSERRPIPGKPKQAKEYETEEDVKTIRRSIYELRSNLVFRILILLLMTLLSGYFTLAGQYTRLPIPDIFNQTLSPQSYTVVQILFGLVSMLCSTSVLKNGIKKLFQLRADCDTIAALSILSSMAAAVSMVNHTEMLASKNVHIYISVAIFSLLCNAIGKLMIVNRAARNFTLVSSGMEQYALVCMENEKRAESLTRGTLGDFPILAMMRKTDFLSDFLRYTFSTDSADKFCRITTPFLLLFSLVLSIFLTTLRAAQLQTPVCFGLSVFAMCFSACACVSVTMISNLPLNKGTKKYVKNKAIMLGYQSVDDFFDVNSVMIDAATLFPEGTINMSAIKIFSDTKIDDAILDAASLTKHAGSILHSLFRDAIVGDSNMLRRVENFTYEESMGICGWINNKRVLFGNRELMVSHNIEGLPTKGKENEFTEGGKDAIYLSVSGNLAALFVVDIQANAAVRYWMGELEAQNLCLLIKSNDAIVSLRRISQLFEVSQEQIKIIPTRMHADFDAETKPVARISASMACAGRFAGMVQLLLGAKAIKSASTLGIILQAASAGLGLLIVLIYLIMRAYGDLSASLFLIYNLIWMVVTLFMINAKKI